MHPYIEINTHHIGTSHIQNNLDCEDYSASYADELVSIAVISDGHGDKNCFRSKTGAQIACKTAISLCKQFQIATEQIVDVEQCNFSELLRSLENEIVDTWKSKVIQDAKQNPFSEAELKQASEQAQASYRAGNRIEKAYGCTLILTVITQNYWYGIQIGDGKCVAAFDDGVFVEPIPTDEENCCGNRSTSLCNSNAKDLFRHYYGKQLPLATFVVSDGVEESFDQAGLYNCFFSVAYWVKDSGLEVARQKIDELLPQISAGGSGDDVSISALICSEKSLSKPRQTLDQVYEKVNACKDVLDRYATAFANTEDELNEKRKAEADLDNEIRELERKIEDLGQKKALLEKQCSEIAIKQAEIKEKQEKATEQMDKARKYQSAAEAYWTDKLTALSIPINKGEIQDEVVSPSEEKDPMESKDSSLPVNNTDSPQNDEVKVPKEDEVDADIQQQIATTVEELLDDEKNAEAGKDVPDDRATEDYSKLSFEELTEKYRKFPTIQSQNPDTTDQSDNKRWHLLFKKQDKNERR